VTKPIPLLLISDSPSAVTGLARITRDIALRVHQHMPDVFRVACLGYGGGGSQHLPFREYYIQGMENWIIPELPAIWDDWAEGQRGIVMTIWDPSRLLWLSRPENCLGAPKLQEWLKNRPFDLYGYFPIDAAGPYGRLSFTIHQTMRGYERILCYSSWAKQMVASTFGTEESMKHDRDWLPHGIDTDVFKPRDRALARKNFSAEDDELMIGIVATNQARKDYGLGIAAVAEVAKSRKVRLWIHTDALERYWSIPALLIDYDLIRKTKITLAQFEDDDMAKLYSACDVTLGIGLGEGFGYPIAESLACGVPCVHGAYGGAEYVPEEFQMEPSAWRLEGLYNSVRPVHFAADWAFRVLNVAGEPAGRPSRLAWPNLWPCFEQWFKRGLK
jgi:glycosyltransferase involved in cell wall biosynthesis